MDGDEVLAEMRRWSDIIRCAEIERQEMRRTVLIKDPTVVANARAWLVAAGLDDIITVHVSPFVPDGEIYILDEQSLEADLNESVQHWRPTW